MISEINFDNFIPSDQYKIYNYYFEIADIDECAQIAALEASLLLQRSHLPNEILGKIWDFADVQNKGKLDRKSFMIALKAVSFYQNRNTLPSNLDELNAAKVSFPNFGPLPLSILEPASPEECIKCEESFIKSSKNIDNKWIVVTDSVTEPNGDLAQFRSTLTNKPKSVLIADLDKEFKRQFRNVATDNMISGDQCRLIMYSSGLPNETLAKIWSDCDKDGKGSLNEQEFIRAMRMINLSDRTSGLLISNNNISSNDKLSEQLSQLLNENKLLRTNQLSYLKTKVVEKKSELSRLESEIELAARLTNESSSSKSNDETKLEKSKMRIADFLKQIEESNENLKSLINLTSERQQTIERMKMQSREQSIRRQSIPDQILKMKSKQSIIEQRVKFEQTHVNELIDKLQLMESNQTKYKQSIERLQKFNNLLSDLKKEINSKNPNWINKSRLIVDECVVVKESLIDRKQSPQTRSTPPLMKNQSYENRTKSAIDFNRTISDDF